VGVTLPRADRGSTLTAQQPENNVVRVAVQALAAVLGGAQSLHTNSRDDTGAADEDAVRIALRTQQILAHESGVADIVDPLGGSYAVEALTTRIEADAQTYLDKIDRMGGMLRAIEMGFVQKEIQEAAYQAQRALKKAPGRGGGQRVRQRGRGARPGLRRGRAAGPSSSASDSARSAPGETPVASRPPAGAGVGRARKRQPPASHPGCRQGLRTVGEICDALRDVLASTRKPWVV